MAWILIAYLAFAKWKSICAKFVSLVLISAILDLTKEVSSVNILTNSALIFDFISLILLFIGTICSGSM